MSNKFQFQLLKFEDLLLFCVMYHCKQNKICFGFGLKKQIDEFKRKCVSCSSNMIPLNVHKLSCYITGQLQLVKSLTPKTLTPYC